MRGLTQVFDADGALIRLVTSYMREIKFRAWDKDEKRWVDPERIYIGANGDLLSYGSHDDTGGFYTDIDIQFFTGLHDKNGKEIYEGDVVEVEDGPNKKNYPIIFHKRTAAFTLEVGNGATEYLPNHVAYKQIEIIGNIYENPELLK